MASVLLKFAGFAALSAMAAVLTIFSWAFKTGESPSDDGPRALIAEFTGYCIGFDLAFYSFTSLAKRTQWELRGLSVIVFLLGLCLSAYFANTPEVSEASNSEPTGFKNNMTDLQIK